MPWGRARGPNRSSRAMQEYDEIADSYIATRRPQVGVSEIAEFAASLAAGSRVLDLGCGDGIPVSQMLVRRGFAICGIDSSANMIEKFRSHFPGAPAQCARIQDSDFFQTSFHAVIAWGVLFHLTPADQEAVIAKVAKSLEAGGRFLFTSGAEEGVVESAMHGVTFRYISLGSSNYTRLLHTNGMRLVSEHFDEWDNYSYIAEKMTL